MMKLMVTFCLLAFQLAASACSVPVFRYALERWPVSPYFAVVVADAPLTAEEQAAVTLLKKASDGVSGSLNLMVRQLTTEELAKSRRTEALPASKGSGTRMHLLYPSAEDIEVPIWSGPLTRESARKMIDTPFRKALAKKIVEGNCGVFILLESGNKARDDAAAKAMDGYIAEVAKTLKLPDGVVEADGNVTGGGPIGYDPIDRLQSAIPLKVAFTSLRLPRKGTDDLMVALLTHLEADLKTYSDQPMVFAVYGRGRALPPLVGAGITLDNIGAITSFLTGACSCQVKSMNPGVDLLLDYDWDRAVFGQD
ncbi:MAG: hypothetical protein HN919_10495 [Verrucomicrobia bacterium]|nr:hypothetical protein [Verrucomicrobiota bacterium]MBT7066721.1 hypothetical protein [Verrucomicrobiota bacterium]MBT7700788.1 hypothetical protein [Verrucomicrobiota bacterium]